MQICVKVAMPETIFLVDKFVSDQWPASTPEFPTVAKQHIHHTILSDFIW